MQNQYSKNQQLFCSAEHKHVCRNRWKSQHGASSRPPLILWPWCNGNLYFVEQRSTIWHGHIGSHNSYQLQCVALLKTAFGNAGHLSPYPICGTSPHVEHLCRRLNPISVYFISFLILCHVPILWAWCNPKTLSRDSL